MPTLRVLAGSKFQILLAASWDAILFKERRFKTGVYDVAGSIG